MGRPTEAESMRQKATNLCRQTLGQVGSTALVKSLRKGIVALSKRDPWGALQHFGRFFQDNPTDAPAWVYVGLLLLDCNLVPEALYCLLQGFSTGILECGILLDQLTGAQGYPKNFIGLASDAYVASVISRFYNISKGKQFIDLIKDRQHATIVRHHEEYLAWNRRSHLIQSGILAALFAQGQHEKALNLAHEFVDHDPSNPDKHSALGIAHLGMKQLDEGIHEFKTAIGLDPTRSQDWNQLADLYLSLEDYTNAEHAATMALFWHPMSVDYWKTLGGIYAGQGQEVLSTLASSRSRSLAILGVIVPGVSSCFRCSVPLGASHGINIDDLFSITHNPNRLSILGASIPDSSVWLRFLHELGLPEGEYDPKVLDVFRLLLAKSGGLPDKLVEPFNLHVLAHLTLVENPEITRGALGRVLGIGTNRVAKIIETIK